MSENELSNGFDTDGISKLNRETDDADEENIDISTTKSENNYEDNFDIPVQKKINEKKITTNGSAFNCYFDSSFINHYSFVSIFCISVL